MASVGVLILGSILGSVICAKARVPAGAVVFAMIALVLFVGTPAGSWLPGVAAGFISTVDSAATPALTHGGTSGTTSPARAPREAGAADSAHSGGPIG